jgi:CRP-like cAMP-binding protein|nr:MAG: Crp/Fnr family transcriptional regulator [Bacteroidota bacterium]
MRSSPVIQYFPIFPEKRKRVIPASVLNAYNARLVKVEKDQILFEEGRQAVDYFQVEEGKVKMYVLNPDGQEFTQGIFSPGESFGEPPLLGDFPYPSSAITLEAGKIWRMAKSDFMRLLKENFDIHMKLDQVLCRRLQYKSMILTEVSSYDPEHRLLTIIKYFKSKIAKHPSREKVIVPFTRQQLADMTGLRVETVIRTVKKMEKEGKLVLEGHKIKF